MIKDYNSQHYRLMAKAEFSDKFKTAKLKHGVKQEYHSFWF